MITIHDNAIPEKQLEEIKASAMESGFGTWQPLSARLGHPVTPGMNWQGFHAPLHIAVYNAMGEPIFPNHCFFKITNKDDNNALVHSDHNDGPFTAIAYLSNHEFVSGTGFYRHLPTGRLTMPSVQEMREAGTLDQWESDMRDESKWEQIDFVRGVAGRLLIFSAPLFHSRIPRVGIGETLEEGRMIWVSHFFTASSLK